MNRFATKRMISFPCVPGFLTFLFGSLLWLSCQTLVFAGDPPPKNLAANSAYRLNPGDKLEITVWHEENLHSEVVVLPDGTVSFPLVGHVPAARKTTEELAALLRERLGKFIPGPEINIRLISAEGNTIYVIGEVAHPGSIVMPKPMDVMQALSMAGGLTQFAKKNSIHILRREADGRSQTLDFEYGEVEDGENMGQNILLQSGDTIVVP